MDYAEYQKAKIKLAIIIFIIIFIIIQIYSIFFVTVRIQGVRRFEEIPTPPIEILNRAIEQRNQAIQEAILAQIILSLLGALVSYHLAEFALKPIQENIKKQKEFLMYASHELKTPITNLMLLTEDESTGKYLSIKDELERLQNSTQKYLEILSKENYELVFNFEEIKIHDLINQVLDKFKNSINYLNINVLNNIPLDEVIISDKEILFSVLRNIIENGIKNIGTDKTLIFNLAKSEDSKTVEITNSFTKRQSGFGIGTKIIKFYESKIGYKYEFTIQNNQAVSKLRFTIHK